MRGDQINTQRREVTSKSSGIPHSCVGKVYTSALQLIQPSLTDKLIKERSWGTDSCWQFAVFSFTLTLLFFYFSLAVIFFHIFNFKCFLISHSASQIALLYAQWNFLTVVVFPAWCNSCLWFGVSEHQAQNSLLRTHRVLTAVSTYWY